eukprot:gene24585-10198_t
MRRGYWRAIWDQATWNDSAVPGAEPRGTSRRLPVRFMSHDPARGSTCFSSNHADLATSPIDRTMHSSLLKGAAFTRTSRYAPVVTGTRSSNAIRMMPATVVQAAKYESTPEVVKTLQGANAFCFDVDSTFCSDESIDELAAFLGCGEEVAALTAKAMGGTVEFKVALSNRLGVMKPSQKNVDDFLALNGHKISPGIPELLAELKSQGKEVFLVSGGFRQIIEPLAKKLDIPVSHVFANNILFDADGAYAGFDDKEFTCQSGGKPAAICHIKSAFGLESIIMVGDGATDMEARLEGAADLFIGYGGVVVRENIADKADWYIMKIEQLLEAMKA